MDTEELPVWMASDHDPVSDPEELVRGWPIDGYPVPGDNQPGT